MRALLIPLPMLCLLATACSDDAEPGEGDFALIERDPVIARALHDPLMSDPDLASRNEANAVLGFVDSDALPVFKATSREAQAARDALRLELLEGGTIPPLPQVQAGSGKAPGPMTGAAQLLAMVGAPARCAAGLTEDFALAASLPPPAAIPPLAMVMQAGGSDAQDCRIRIIRYASAAPRADVLEYHHARAVRAGLEAVRPGDSITARGTGAERLAVHVRTAPGGLTGVTLVYRAP
ncbi:hypothetical protein CHX26_07990 [Porphyrobacter sp. HT-58-2]|uniref:hypothetical protein n=1 Tax=Porphyrobacter sp. HT-58-2 TaxID=2023229 RepID=UPI000CDBCE9F|nr:hypothetical protein [Porphyrobacter sp. HT-58-2]AUX69440.1 hypothetical protein CHX26_07990 [Porphyrobacter sp. HT-58-2]